MDELDTVKIGIITPEFPPELGGMHNLAFGLANALAATDEVVVALRRDFAPPAGDAPAFERRALLGENLEDDAKALNAIDPDLWLAMNGGLLPILGRLDAPSFVYLHGNDFLSPWITYGSRWIEPIKRPYMRKVRQFLRKRSLRASASVPVHYFTNSTRTASLAQRALGLDADRVSVCPPGVADEFFQAHDPGGNGRIDMVSVARLTKYSRRKNIDGIISAVAELSGELDATLTVVGDGDDVGRLRNLATELGVETRIRFAGRLSDRELLAEYRKSDLFVLASKASATDVEGFGIVYLEACASGVPVMGSAQGGATDAIVEGTNGILLPDSSPAAIADGIRRFNAERARFSPDAIRAWAESYRWPRIAGRLRSAILARMPVPRGRSEHGTRFADDGATQ